VDNYAKVRDETNSMRQEFQPSKLTGSNDRQPFITIDELTRLATELQIGLSKLGEYKYPLDVRKGVRQLHNERESMTVKAPGRMYFLDLKETKEGNLYLVITESRSKKDSEERERSSIVVFKENAKEFADAVASMVSKIGS
jgi:hypothetical protein